MGFSEKNPRSPDAKGTHEAILKAAAADAKFTIRDSLNALAAVNSEEENPLSRWSGKLFEKWFGEKMPYVKTSSAAKEPTYLYHAYERVLDVFKAMYGLLSEDNLLFKDDNTLGSKAHGKSVQGKRVINVGPAFYRSWAAERRATIVHELSHIVADTTDDGGHGIENALKRAKKPFNPSTPTAHATDVAYNYEWFAVKATAGLRGLARSRNQYGELYDLEKEIASSVKPASKTSVPKAKETLQFGEVM
jgi:hypothetical protein